MSIVVARNLTFTDVRSGFVEGEVQTLFLPIDIIGKKY